MYELYYHIILCGITTVKLGTCILYVFLCKGHVQVLIGALFLLVSIYKICTSSSLSGDYMDVNSNKSSTIYDSPKTMN